MNKKKFYLIFYLLFAITFSFINLSFLQSGIFDTFTIESEKDIFLEFEVDTSLQYNLFVIDSYNSSVFGMKYNLEYAIASIYKKDKKTAYPSSIYVSPFKEGGITTSQKEPVASFKPLENIVYIRVRGTSIKSSGTFGIALISLKNKKVPYKVSKSIFNDLHKEAITKNNLEQYKIIDGKALKFIYNVEKDKEYKLILVDAFNNSLFGSYFTLDGLWFHVMDENGNFYNDIYSSSAEDGGITSLSNIYAAKFIAKSTVIQILVEPISLIYDGTFGIKLEQDGKVIKPKSIEDASPIGYESRIEQLLSEEVINLDNLEIKDQTIKISFNTEIGKTYYIYLADNYNASVYEKSFTFKDLFFQIFDSDNILVQGCYASEIIFEEQIGGITLLSSKPSASFEAKKSLYYIIIKSFTRCISGTFGLQILDSDKNSVKYEILTK